MPEDPKAPTTDALSASAGKLRSTTTADSKSKPGPDGKDTQGSVAEKTK